MTTQAAIERKAPIVENADVWMHIMNFADPVDILSLRKTCSALREVSARLSVWIAAAKRICANHGLFSAVFPLTTMSRLELEQLALGPSRFASLVKEPIKDDRRSRTPNRTRTFYPKAQPDGENPHINSLRLLPGGRYLLTWTKLVGLFLWDLGLNACAPLPTLPLAHLPSKARFELAQATPTPDRQGVRIRCTARLSSGEVVRVYEIMPASEEPAFRHVRACTLPQAMDIQIAQSSQYIAVAAQLQETVAIYSIDAKDYSGSLRRIKIPGGVLSHLAIAGDTLMVSSRHRMYTVKIPEEGPTSNISVSRLKSPGSNVLYSSDWVDKPGRHTLCEFDEVEGRSVFHTTTEMVLWKMEIGPDTEPESPVYQGCTAPYLNVTGEKDLSVTIKYGNVLQQNPTHFFVMARKTRSGEWESDFENQVMVLKYPLRAGPAFRENDSINSNRSHLPKPDVLMLTAHGQYPERNVSLDQIDVCCSSGRLIVATAVGFDAAAERQERKCPRRYYLRDEERWDLFDSEDEDYFGEDSDEYSDDPEYAFEESNRFIGGHGPSEIRIIDFLGASSGKGH